MGEALSEAEQGTVQIAVAALRAGRYGMSDVFAAVERILADRRAAEGDLRARIEALYGGEPPPVFLSDKPNKVYRLQQRRGDLGATVTESYIKVSDLRAVLAQPTTDGSGQ